MIVLEPGPGMGFFTREMARRVGPNGRVIAIDVQSKMLKGLVKRAAKAGLAERIDARLMQGDHLNINDYAGRVDFALAFAIVHEVSNSAALFADMHGALRPTGKLLFVEPGRPCPHSRIRANLTNARRAGFEIDCRPSFRHSHAAVLVRG
jgi:SAM-dependent methyltransferase